jgi:hypothetical protein
MPACHPCVLSPGQRLCSLSARQLLRSRAILSLTQSAMHAAVVVNVVCIAVRQISETQPRWTSTSSTAPDTHGHAKAPCARYYIRRIVNIASARRTILIPMHCESPTRYPTAPHTHAGRRTTSNAIFPSLSMRHTQGVRPRPGCPVRPAVLRCSTDL